jgi:outer membrane protein
MKKALILFIVSPLLLAKSITFNQALELTLSNNKELKAKTYNVALAKETLKEPTAHKMGKLEFAENISRTNHPGHVFGMKLSSREATFNDFGFGYFIDSIGGLMNPSTAMQTRETLLNHMPQELNAPEARNNFETKLIYEVPLFTGFKLENAETMAQLQLLAQQAKLSHDKKQIGLEVMKAYNGAVAAKKFIAMTQEATTIAKRFQQTAQELYDSGLTRAIDVHQAKMAASSIGVKTKEAQTQFNLAIAYLQFLTSDTTISDVETFKLFTPSKTSLNRLQAKALQQRDDYQWMQHNVDTMKTKIAYESSDDYPIVGLHAQYGTNDDQLSLSSDKDYYLVAVGIKKTLFNGGLTSIAKQKAKIEYAKTKEYHELMGDGIRLEVKKNLLEYKTLSKTLKEKLTTKKMAETILHDTEEIYKNNLKFRTNMMYLLMGLENMLKAQADVITTTYNKAITSAKLKLSIGSSLRN